jgi:Asp-tRNA(Asn)/Glu-tRNA(Gln) amidotransferase A subunit family amidase
MTDLTQHATVALAAALGRGDVKAVDVVDAFLARIAERDPEIKAWVHVNADSARKQAEACDQMKMMGRPTGPLHGVPIGVKDIVDTADMPTQYGSPLFKDHQPEQDAVVVQRLRRAGAIVLGKTVTTQLASLVPAETRNPINPEHTPGGSSSGSAAAVADGMIPAAICTQTGGSVIRPASFCGIFGLKPSFGMIPRTGVLSQSPTLDTVGVYGKCVEDLALLLDVVAGPDSGDPAAMDNQHAGFLATASEKWSIPPSFAFVKTPQWDSADPVTREAFTELVASLGSQVEECSINFNIEKGLEAQAAINAVEAASRYGKWYQKNPEAFGKPLADLIERGLRTSGAVYFEAREARETIYRAISELFLNYNAILTPSALGPAPKGLGSTGDAVMNRFWTLLGTPCVTLPLLGDDNGMPMGVQLVGQRRDDGRLLRTARLLLEQLSRDEAA